MPYSGDDYGGRDECRCTARLGAWDLSLDMGKLTAPVSSRRRETPNDWAEVCKQLGADDVIDCSSSELIEERYHPIAAVSVLGVKGVAHLQVHLFPSVDAVPSD